MNKKFSRILCAALAASLCVASFSACTPAEQDEKKLDWLQTINSYEDDKTMLIGAHGEPEPNLVAYRTAKEMGLTFTFIAENLNNPTAYDLAEEVGLKVIPSLGNTLSSYKGVDWSKDWSQYPAVFAVDYFDEPVPDQLPIISEWVDMHNEKYAQSQGAEPLFWVNMLPLDSHEFAPLTDEEFIAKYCNDVLSKIEGTPILSFDFYAMRTMWYQGEKEYDYVADEWLRTLELNAKYAKQYGADTHAYIQTCGFYVPDPRYHSWNCRMADEADLRFQVYTSMAFGIRNFTHFTYKTSELYGNETLGYTKSCVDKDGTINPLYYDAQAVNRELLEFDHIYLSFDYIGTKSYIGSQNESGTNEAFSSLEYGLQSIEGLSGVTCSQDTLVGSFKDADGRKGYIVTNYTDPKYGLSDEVTLSVAEGITAFALYSKGEWREVKAENGSASFTLEPGQGVFLIAVE